MAKINYTNIKIAAALTALFNNIQDVIEEINIHDVLKISSGENLPTHKMIDGEYPVFGGGGATNLTHNIFNVSFETLAIGRVGARCGCVFKVPKNSWVTDNALYALKYDNRFNLDFLIHYLSYVDLNQYANRAAQPVISLKRISSIKIPLIEYSRQKNFINIIEQVENGKTYFGEEYNELNKALKSVDSINQLQNEFGHQQIELENLNQAILQEAVQGKLVKQDLKDEPASELLKRIKVEKAKSDKKDKSLLPIKPEEIPFEIPKNWEWCRLSDIVSILGDGIHGTPNYDKNGDYYFINGNNLTDGKIEIKDTTKRVAEVEFLKYRKQLNHNSVFVSINGTLGNLAFYNGERIILGKSACYFNLHNEILREYIGIYINSSYFLKYAIEVASETTIKNVSLKSMRLLPIPLPPISEQKRIVIEIEKQLTKTKLLKEHIIANQQATEQLLKALLHQAFVV